MKIEKGWHTIKAAQLHILLKYQCWRIPARGRSHSIKYSSSRIPHKQESDLIQDKTDHSKTEKPQKSQITTRDHWTQPLPHSSQAGNQVSRLSNLSPEYAQFTPCSVLLTVHNTISVRSYYYAEHRICAELILGIGALILSLLARVRQSQQDGGRGGTGSEDNNLCPGGAQWRRLEMCFMKCCLSSSSAAGGPECKERVRVLRMSWKVLDKENVSLLLEKEEA